MRDMLCKGESVVPTSPEVCTTSFVSPASIGTGSAGTMAGCRRQMRYSSSAFFEKSAVCSSLLKPEMISV